MRLSQAYPACCAGQWSGQRDNATYVAAIAEVTHRLFCRRIERLALSPWGSPSYKRKNMTDASASPAKQEITVRPVEGVSDMRACVELQQRVWAYSDLDTVPENILVVAQKSGGHVLLALDGQQPVGFAMAFAAFRDGQAHLHSHMLAVLDSHQNRGVGRLLKLAQREAALARGFDLIEWTFDPLQLKNAYFNLHRLGVIVRQYLPNVYGVTSSPLHAGLPTDRLVAEWWLRSLRVQNALEGRPQPATSSQTRISLPASIRDICREDPAAAERIQSDFRRQFQDLLARGKAGVAFEFNGTEGSYVLEPYEAL